MWAWLVKVILDYVVAKLVALFAKLVAQFKRKEEQDAATKKVEEDVQTKAPRDEETKKNEQDWLNS